MRTKASNRKIFIGGWILLGLLILGFNGYHMLVLLDVPLSGYSDSVRTVDRGIRQLKNPLVAENEEIEKGLKELWGRNSPIRKIPVVSRRETAKPPVQNESRRDVGIPLPVLAGILSEWTPKGKVRHLALLDGLVCSEGDTVDGLVVEKISSKGVRLNKNGEAWFVEAPVTSYSLALQ